MDRSGRTGRVRVVGNSFRPLQRTRDRDSTGASCRATAMPPAGATLAHDGMAYERQRAGPLQFPDAFGVCGPVDVRLDQGRGHVGPAAPRGHCVSRAAAPEMLPLRRGDMLVVNASDSAVRSCSTCPEALDAYLRAGVRVYSEGDLHANVIATPTAAGIGSANASAHSRDLALEASIITTARTSSISFASSSRGWPTRTNGSPLPTYHGCRNCGTSANRTIPAASFPA